MKLSIVGAVITAITVMVVAFVVAKGYDRHQERRQEVQLACIEKADGNAEAVLCQDRDRRD